MNPGKKTGIAVLFAMLAQGVVAVAAVDPSDRHQNSLMLGGADNVRDITAGGNTPSPKALTLIPIPSGEAGKDSAGKDCR
ncbi:MAG: hypothetical protein H6935_09015 [Thiobacillus sp.]|nr:hypothetical protein [Thiobacillus sp.]